MRFLHDIARHLGTSDAFADHDQAVRPSIPLFLTFGLAFWGSCACCWDLARFAGVDLCLRIAVAACVAAVVSVVMCFRLRRFFVMALLCGVLVGGGVAFGSAAKLHVAQGEFEARSVQNAVLRAVEDAESGAFGIRCVVEVAFDDGAKCKATAYLDDEIEPPLYGDALVARVISQAASESGYDWAWAHGLAGSLEVLSARPVDAEGFMSAILNVRESAIERMAGADAASGVLQALICAYSASYEDSGMRESFNAAGLAHIVAVSGAHLVVVSSFVGAVLIALRVPRPALIGIQCALMLGYLVLAGMPLSAIRAFIMAAISQWAYFAGRRSGGLSSLGACIAAMVALDPVVSVSASFALSALSTLGIALYGNFTSAWVGAIAARVPSLLWDALALTLASSLLAQPYSCALFSQLPLVSPLANMLATPLVAPACILGMVGALAVNLVPLLGDALLGAAKLFVGALCAVVEWCASLPLACVPVDVSIMGALAFSFGIAVLLWLWWPIPQRKRFGGRFAVAAALVCAVMLVASTASAWLKGDQLVMLDVGQGDAFLVSSQGSSVLIDTGTEDSLLKRALARQGVASLDAVIITHADDDHCGSLQALGETVRVERVIVAEDALTCDCASCASLRQDASAVSRHGLEGIRAGDRIEVGNFDLEALWPVRYVEDGGNADSLCFLLSHDGNSREAATALMTGDAESEQLASIVQRYRLDAVDILKVGHHGSAKALTAEQAHDLSPSIALVSVGKDNTYGHPAQDILDSLAAVDTRVFRTDEHGDVSCDFTHDGIRVRTLR